jgi:hypothetical protein
MAKFIGDVHQHRSAIRFDAGSHFSQHVNDDLPPNAGIDFDQSPHVCFGPLTDICSFDHVGSKLRACIGPWGSSLWPTVHRRICVLIFRKAVGLAGPVGFLSQFVT